MLFSYVKQGICNKRMLFSCLVTLTLFILSDYFSIFKSMTFADLNAPDLQGNNEAIDFIYSNGHNKYQVWLQSFRHIGFLFPLLVLIPYTSSLWESLSSKNYFFIVIRTSFYKYGMSKFLATCIIGGLAILIPELIYYLTLSLLFHNEVLEHMMFVAYGPMAELFQVNPEGYILFVFINHFCIGVVISAIGMSISVFSKKKIVIFVFPLLLYMVSGILLEAFLKMYSYSPLQWIQLMYMDVDLTIMYSCMFGLFFLSLFIFTFRIHRVRKNGWHSGD